jgi:hypothetical protein
VRHLTSLSLPITPSPIHRESQAKAEAGTVSCVLARNATPHSRFLGDSPSGPSPHTTSSRSCARYDRPPPHGRYLHPPRDRRKGTWRRVELVESSASESREASYQSHTTKWGGGRGAGGAAGAAETILVAMSLSLALVFFRMGGGAERRQTVAAAAVPGSQIEERDRRARPWRG